MRHYRYAILAICVVLLAQALPCSAGNIKGRWYKPIYSDYTDPPPFYPYSYETIFKGIAGVGVTATKEGSLPVGGAGGAETATGEPVGYYDLIDLVPGTYNVMFHEHDEYAQRIIFNQVVPTTSPQELRLYPNLRYQDVAMGMTWDVYPAGTWSQSFVAKGTCVTQVGIHQTTEFGPNVTVTITRGDPTGPQVGPSRTVPTDVVNPSSVFWSAGEVPTIPGETYCVNLFVPTGFQMYLSGARIQGGLTYPDGRTYKDGQPITAVQTPMGIEPIGPPEMTIYQDNEGIIPVVNTSKYNKPRNTMLVLSQGVTVAGQTFTAMGTSLLSFSCRVQNTGHSSGVLQVTCYRSPGANGEGVTQVGLAKYMQVPKNGSQLLEWQRSGVVWKPNEVPLTPGQTYYIKVKAFSGQPFDIWTTTDNEYAGGAYIKNGVEQPNDLSTTITTEAFPGAATQGKVAISGINVTRGTTTATVNWTTDVATTTNYVEWSEETPYTNRTDGDAGGTSHSVTLTGLQPNTQYHYRVVSKTAGKHDNYSRDFVFVTNPDQPNLLSNPGFETGAVSPWVEYSISGGSRAPRNYPWTPTGEPSYFGFQAHGGNWFYGSACNGTTQTPVNKGGVYQRVPATPGDVMVFRAWVITYQTDPFPASYEYVSRARVGIDPTGGTDPNSSAIVWGPWILAQDCVGAVESATGKGSWTEAFVRASAVSDHVTVYFMAGGEKPIRWVNWGLDDAVLTTVTAQPVEKIADLAALADGTLVRLTDKLVTATNTEVGANYVMEPKVAGLRVESANTFTRGHWVTIQGRKGTKPSGEPYIYEAAVVTDSAGSEAGPLTTQAQVLGAKKPTNVGMLMQVAGKIYVDWSQNYYINDGSLPGNGLKIKTSHLGTLPNVDGYYDITGIVQLEGTAPNVTPVLCPRDDTDLIFWGWFD